MFKVGDVVKGTQRGNEAYSIANEGMLKAEVTEDYGDGEIEIVIIDHMDSDHNGEFFDVEVRYFDLVSSTSVGAKATAPKGTPVPKPKNDYETLVVLGLL